MGRNYFKNTLDLLKSFEQPQTYQMEILPDEEGYIDKECPNDECLSKFKVLATDWGDKIIPQDKCYCPFCGFEKGYKSWFTTEQVKQAEKQAVEQIEAQLGQALSADVKEFNRQQPRRAFIKMNMRFTGKMKAVNLPAEALEIMQQKIVCEKCGTCYAVIGSGFFCPCCGENSAITTFSHSIGKVKAKLNNLSLVKSVISSNSKDDAEFACQSLIESSISELVVALQRLCEKVYVSLPNSQSLKKNVFQRLNDSNILWKNICGKNYIDWLTATEYDLLIRCFQKRHILQHQDGIVDQEYIDKSKDKSYAVGQRVVIKEQEILEYLCIFEKLGNAILSLK